MDVFMPMICHVQLSEALQQGGDGKHLCVELSGEQGATVHGDVDVTTRTTRDGVRVQYIVALDHMRPRYETKIVLWATRQSGSSNQAYQAVKHRKWHV